MTTTPHPWGRDDLMAVAAVRYCIGRMTYIVDDCCEWLPQAWPQLRPGARSVILRDLREAIQRDDEARERGESEYRPLGMDMDRQCWEALLARLEAAK